MWIMRPLDSLMYVKPRQLIQSCYSVFKLYSVDGLQSPVCGVKPDGHKRFTSM